MASTEWNMGFYKMMNINLELLHKRRDLAIREMWSIMRDISDFHIGKMDDMSAEDLDVWEAVTKHSAVQSRLDEAFSPEIGGNPKKLLRKMV